MYENPNAFTQISHVSSIIEEYRWEILANLDYISIGFRSLGICPSEFCERKLENVRETQLIQACRIKSSLHRIYEVSERKEKNLLSLPDISWKIW